MLEFIQANWLWILFGLSFLFMFRMHGAGGCGMGHGSHGGAHRHEDESDNGADAANHRGYGSGGTTAADDADHAATSKTPAGHRHGGC